MPRKRENYLGRISLMISYINCSFTDALIEEFKKESTESLEYICCTMESFIDVDAYCYEAYLINKILDDKKICHNSIITKLFLSMLADADT